MTDRQSAEPRAPRPDKVETVEALAQTLQESKGALLTDYRGLTVKAMEELRGALRARGASYLVVKNTMLSRAAARVNYGELQEWLEGPTAAVFLGEDIVGPAKALLDFVKANANLPAVKGGLVEGHKMSAAQVRELAALPPREILLAILIGQLQSPLSSLAATLQAPLASLVGTLQALEQKKAS